MLKRRFVVTKRRSRVSNSDENDKISQKTPR